MPMRVHANEPDVKNARALFDHYAATLYADLELEKYHLSYEAFSYALMGYLNLKNAGQLSEKNVITIIDYSLSSRQDRFFTIDLDKKQVVFHTLVAHGSNSGLEYARYFSNRLNSHQSSLGFYVTGSTYVGQNGYSLILTGLDNGFNDNARRRSIVIHQADYVDPGLAETGRIGRSWGCPAIPQDIYKQVIDYIKGGTCVFAYYHDEKYLHSSVYLNVEEAARSLVQSGIGWQKILNP